LAEIHPSNAISNDLLDNLQLGVCLEIARRRKWWIILSTIGLFVSATVVARRMPDTFRAETVILVNSAEVPDKYVPSINTGDIGGRLTTLQQQVLSPTRLKKMAELEGLYSDPSGKLAQSDLIPAIQKSITVEVVNSGGGRMGAFRIAYTSRKRDEVARVANHLAQMFIEENLKVRVDQTEGTAQFLRDQLQETKRQMDEKDTQLHAIKSRNILAMPESKSYHMEALANLRSQVQAIQEKIQRDQGEKSILHSILASGEQAPTIDVEQGSDGSGGVRNPYQAQIQKLEAKLADLRVRYGPGHPDVRKVQGELDRARSKAAAEAQNSPGTSPAESQQVAIQAQPRRRNPVIEAQIEKFDEEIAEQSKLLAPLQSRMQAHEAKLADMPVFEQQIERMQQDFDVLRSQYTGLLEKEKAAEISHALEVRQKGEKFEVLDYATTPGKPAAPNRLLISLGALFGGLLAGVGLAAVTEMSDESVRSESEATRILGKPVLIGVPLIVTRQERRLAYLRAVGILVGTVVGSAALGFLFSLISGRLS